MGCLFYLWVFLKNFDEKVLNFGASVFVVLAALFFDQQAGDFFRFEYV